jgi:hypothetical protein
LGYDGKNCNVLRTVALYLLTQEEMRVGVVVEGGGGGGHADILQYITKI